MNTQQETYDQRLARKRKERGEFNAQMYSVYKEVADILGFTLDPDNDSEPIEQRYNARATLRGEGVALYMVTSHTGTGWSKQGMINISSDFPTPKRERQYVKPFDYNYQPIRIYVSSKKTAKQIARDIERRFLPTHKKEMQDVIKRCADTDGYHEGRERIMQNIASETGLIVDKRGDNDWSIDIGDKYGNKCKPSGRNEVELSFNVNKDQAIAIIKCAIAQGVKEDKQ